MDFRSNKEMRLASFRTGGVVAWSSLVDLSKQDSKVALSVFRFIARPLALVEVLAP
jgi:hypothetical protein